MEKFPCRRRCENCQEQIEPGSTVLKLACWRRPTSDIEDNIYGDEVPMADRFFCECCADFYLSITELGYCVSLQEGENFITTWKELNHERTTSSSQKSNR